VGARCIGKKDLELEKIEQGELGERRQKKKTPSENSRLGIEKREKTSFPWGMTKKGPPRGVGGEGSEGGKENPWRK